MGTGTGGCSVPHSGKGPRQAACSGRCSEPAGDAGLWQLHPARPLPACRPTCPLPTPTPRGRPRREPGLQRFTPNRSGRLPPWGAWGTCTRPGRGAEVTHTRPDNQHSRVRASPQSRQAVPLPRAVSSACTQRASWAAEGARAATASLGSLCGRLLGLGRRARGDEPRPLPHPAPGLQLWGAAPRAEARPWATTVLPLLGQVNNCCCF